MSTTASVNDSPASRSHLTRIVKPSALRSPASFAADVGEAMSRQRKWFNHLGEVVVVQQGVRGEAGYPMALEPMTPLRAITALEEFILPGVVRLDRSAGQQRFMPRSLERAETAKLLRSPEFKERLPLVRRLLDLPVPVAAGDGSIALPQRGYDERFETYCDPDAPEPESVPLNKALNILEEAHTDFPWRDERSRVHALARMITPFCRGLMGWGARTPLWFFAGAIGKDYLASLTEAAYQGANACHYAPDLRGAIGRAIRVGLRRIHFTDSHRRLPAAFLADALRSSQISLKEKRGVATLPFELEVSVSHHRPVMALGELAPVTRLVELATVEDFNQRHFKHPNLREKIRQNRAQVLGAIKALVDHWLAKDRPAGPSSMPLFPEWSRVVGGVMHASGLGDPCLPTRDS